MQVLLIDDERAIRRALREILEFEGCVVEEAENGDQALDKLNSHQFDLIFSDIKMPQMDGLELLDRVLELGIDVPVIMISGHGTVETAVGAIKKGAFDFIEKPLDLNRILVLLRQVKDRNLLVQETKVLKQVVKKIKGSAIIGDSAAISAIKTMIEKVAPSEARVLITGGNGTGKELVARSLHELSNRSKMPFIEVNCAAIPAELIESELFGHEKGAFTSAVKDRKGKFELASGGTLFLDEIGDMSLTAQAKVLRALQENVISRVGGEKDLKVDCRVVAATNKDLREEIKAGRFREDLYHRLAVILIHVPSLNETLFLDEIGDMSLTAQAKVLRALQENVISRVGGEKDLKVDCRVVAATNKDIREEIKAGRFREDLYHRLAVILIHVPSLNERRSDIPQLVSHFIKLICQEHGILEKSIDPAAVEALSQLNWTGNIRELRNIIERLIILSDQCIMAADVNRYANPSH
jgi:two-component system nitrogen regulation response regulator NtrX